MGIIVVMCLSRRATLRARARVVEKKKVEVDRVEQDDYDDDRLPLEKWRWRSGEAIS